MGFLDKAKEQAEKLAKQGQDKLEEVQSKKKADGLLRDLGAWYYASHTGRDDGRGQSEIDRVVGELKSHEAEFGPLGGGDDQAAAPGGSARGPGPQTHAVPQVPAPAGIVPPPPPPTPSGENPPAPIISPPPPPPPPPARSGDDPVPPVVPTPPAPPTPPVADGGTTLDDL